VELTKAGEVLHHYAQEIMKMHQLAKRAVSDLVEMVSGDLKIGASFTIGEYVLPRLLGAFSQKYTEVMFSELIGNTEFIHEKTRERVIDFGLVEGLVEDSHLIIEPFLQDELVFIAAPGHPLAKKTFLTREDISNIPFTFIMREVGSGTKLAMDDVLHELKLKPLRIMTMGSTQAIKEAVEANLGISFISKWALRKELQLGTLKLLRIKDFNVTREFYLIRNKDKFESKATEEFAKFIMDRSVSKILG